MATTPSNRTTSAAVNNLGMSAGTLTTPSADRRCKAAAVPTTRAVAIRLDSHRVQHRARRTIRAF